jgi:glycolate oxidase iron-sulfur subunit
MRIEEHYDQIARCNHCGFCQVACPIFRATGHEAGVARGRIALLRGLIEKRSGWDESLKEPLFNCLLCGACTANCFPAIATADLILEARSEYLERVGRTSLHKLLFDHLLPHPRRLRLAARAARLSKRSGLTRVAGALGLLRAFGRDFPRAEQIVGQLPRPAFRDRLKPGVMPGRGELRIGYFVGCGTDIVCPEAAEATLRLLGELGQTVQVLDNCCCGLPAMTYGDFAAARRLAGQNLALLAAGPFDLIVTDCSSCAAFLKKYPALFGDDEARHDAAVAIAPRVRDLVELLPRERIVAGTRRVPSAERDRVVVTYHDPCHASRGQGLAREPREVLCLLDGVEFREMPEADWCCGGAGSYALSHYDLAQKVLDRKMDNLERTGASCLVTSCPACIIHLRHGVRQRRLPVRVCHIAELVSGKRGDLTDCPSSPVCQNE